jgi:hypothetical protein
MYNDGTQKDLDKNQIHIDELNKFIDENKENIDRVFVNSYVRRNILAQINTCTDKDFNHRRFKYKGITFIEDIYQRNDSVYFVMKENVLKFNPPCVCGIYSDEVHP